MQCILIWVHTVLLTTNHLCIPIGVQWLVMLVNNCLLCWGSRGCTCTEIHMDSDPCIFDSEYSWLTMYQSMYKCDGECILIKLQSYECAYYCVVYGQCCIWVCACYSISACICIRIGMHMCCMCGGSIFTCMWIDTRLSVGASQSSCIKCCVHLIASEFKQLRPNIIFVLLIIAFETIAFALMNILVWVQEKSVYLSMCM